MTTLTVYDSAMCCATGLCGTEVDQRLVDMAADLDWLKAQGVAVQRFGLSREPAAFAANDTVRQIMQDSDGDDLPVFLVDGVLKAKAHYPSRAELADWTGAVERAGCCGGSAKAEPARTSGCCVAGATSAPTNEKVGGCC